ncbi:MAG: DNA replication/repair protein RecF [Muribaculaceae bacterium]|jgi:DNA replication and repair protein RecF|nr:DNA replication/repair protein RecF [Muribaculaceae bacterium]
MILRSLDITNFKNIERARLEFSPKVNALLGDNGMGKSNLLDAVHLLSFTKSFTGAQDQMLIRSGEDFAIVRGTYSRMDAEEDILAGLQRGRRKSFKRGGKEYGRISAHIGLLPLVMVSPADMELINGSGEERRRFMDMVISQTDPRYLDAAMRYARILEQRNRLLRDGAADHALFEAIDFQLDAAAAYISARRHEWTAELRDIFSLYYKAISGSDEEPGLTLVSHTGPGCPALADLLRERFSRDSAVRHTTAGPHRDDLEMTLDGMPVRRTASQGQCKTFTIALRLAQYGFLRRACGMSPLLLLDDIFDKLDAGRVGRIISTVGADTFGQIFITDTNRRHLDEIVAFMGADHRLWSVEHGRFSVIDG